MALLSMAKFGALHGVVKQSVAQWKSRGLLVIVDGKIDVDPSNANLKKLRIGGAPGAAPTDEVAGENVRQLTTDEQRSIRGDESASRAAERILIASGAEMTIDEARRLKENYLALLNQLEYDQKSGLVVLVSEVAKAVGSEYAKVRTRLLSIPAEQAPRVHRLKTVTEVQDALQELITEALEELTRDGGN
jgi:hypothetical protein